MGCNASKVPLVVVGVDGNKSSESRRVSALDFTTSTDFFRRSSSILLWKPQESPRSIKKKSVFELFKEQANQEDKKQAQAREQEKEELKKIFNTSLSSSAVRCHYDSDDSDSDNNNGDTTTDDEVLSTLDLK